MKQLNELKKKLIILGIVYDSGWDNRNLIRDMYWAGDLKMIDFEWGDRFRNEHPEMYDPIKKLAKGADQGQEWEWSTFAERVKIELYVKDNRICIELRMEKGDNWIPVSISDPDLKAGSPKIGDMVARNPKNHLDQWLVSKQYFNDNFEEI